jgi:hypothetical protein
MQHIQSGIVWLVGNIKCSSFYILVENCQFSLLSVFSTILFIVKGQNTFEVILYVLIPLTRYLIFPICRRNSLGCAEPCRMRIFCYLFPTLILRTPAPP